MIKSLKIQGVELAPYVISWANIEHVKDTLLAKTTLLVGDVQIKLSNIDGRFSPEADSSLFKGQNLFNTPGKILIDDEVLFNGFIKDIQPDNDSKTVTIVMQDILTIPADNVAPAITLSGVSPADAMLELLQAANFNVASLSDIVDVKSFQAAAGPAIAAGASISVTIPADTSSSILDLIQQISDLGSIAVFQKNGIITAQAYIAYSGNESNLRQEINPSNVQSFGKRETAYDAFNNSVTVSYGASASFTLTDAKSVAITGVSRNQAFDTATGSEVSVNDFLSAEYFANLYLSRASSPPVTVNVQCGKQFFGQKLGDRFPVTIPSLGFVRRACELVEQHELPDSMAVQFVLRTL